MQPLNYFITKPGLLIVDMQKEFVQGKRKEIIPNVIRLRELAQKCNMPVIFVQEIHRASGIDFGVELYFAPLHTREGTEGAKFLPELEPSPSDFVINYKRRYSAFFQTDLDLLLRSLKVETIIMAGVATDVCILATVFDAHARDYFVVVVKDCVSGLTLKGHEGALHIVETSLGKVVTLTELEKALERK